MTRQDFLYKWFFYGLSLLPVWWLELFVLSRFPVLGATPMLLPLAAVAVAVLEGSVSGAGFGLAVGVLCDAVYYGGWGGMTLGMCLIGWGAGAAAQYVLRPNCGGCLLCSAGALAAIDLFRVAAGLFTGLGSLSGLLEVAVPEILWSLCFVCLIYPWYTWVRRRIVKFLRL